MLRENLTLPETNSSHLKIDGWKMYISFWVQAYFQVQKVRFREGIIFPFLMWSQQPLQLHHVSPLFAVAMWGIALHEGNIAEMGTGEVFFFLASQTRLK